MVEGGSMKLVVVPLSQQRNEEKSKRKVEKEHFFIGKD